MNEQTPHVIINGRFYCDVVKHETEANEHTVANCTYSGGGIKCRMCFAPLKTEKLKIVVSRRSSKTV